VCPLLHLVSPLVLLLGCFLVGPGAQAPGAPRCHELNRHHRWKKKTMRRPVFFYLFLALFRKILINTFLLVRFKKMDPSLDAVVIGTKIKLLGASPIGTKLLAHVGVDAELAVTWQPPRRQLC
jgi:hypothetical protein